MASFSEANTNIVEESRGESLCELVPVHRPAQTVTYVISNLYVGRWGFNLSNTDALWS